MTIVLSRFGRPVVLRVLTSSGVDEYGDPADVAVDSNVVGHVRVLSASELPDGVGSTRWKLYLPPGTELDVDDRVVFEATTYEVVRPPVERFNPRTKLVEAIEAEIERTS